MNVDKLKVFSNRIILIKTIRTINIKPNIIPSKKPFFFILEAFIKERIKNSRIFKINIIIVVIPLFKPRRLSKETIKVNNNSRIRKIAINFK